MTLIRVAYSSIMESVDQVNHASIPNSKEKADFKPFLNLLSTLQLDILPLVCVAGEQPK